jgi:SAM-dependent methyltransferase
MNLLEWAHASRVHPRRVAVLSGIVAEMLPPGASVLDVGCGDGLITAAIMKLRPDISITGLDVVARPRAIVPVQVFDGLTIPIDAKSVDVVIFIDVVHHAAEQERLIMDAAQIARKAVIVKDHLLDGFMAGETLKFMDMVGNRRHGVALPYHYWTESKWRSAFDSAGLVIEHWETDLGLYPFPLSLVFGRSLHFVTKLAPKG